MNIVGRRSLVTGGTGSLGRCLVRRLLSLQPESVTVFSRDEAKQHDMRLSYQQLSRATDEVIYREAAGKLRFIIGDIRDYTSVTRAVRDADVVFNAAALKQVPTCEYFPSEAVQTNVVGPHNIVRAIQEHDLPVDTVVGVSTDKAVKPVNVMGMTKALQEKTLIAANLSCPQTRFICVRYGNVLASRGSVIPLFQEQVRRGGPLTITDAGMTRFLISIDRAVDVILAAVETALPGEIYVPRIPSARMSDLACAIIGGRDVKVKITEIRPGEKLHEILISEEERGRVVLRGDHYAVRPTLLGSPPDHDLVDMPQEYSSADNLLSLDDLTTLLRKEGMLLEDET